MSIKLLLLDLDGTCRRCRSNPAGFINSPDDQELIPEAAAALERYGADGWRMVGITNQGGVALGHKTLGSCIDEQLRTMELVPQLDAIFFCPSHPDGDGETCYELTSAWSIETHFNHIADERIKAGYRKPKPGMLVLAVDHYGLFAHDGGQNLMVGDRPEDELAAAAAGVPFMAAQRWWETSV